MITAFLDWLAQQLTASLGVPAAKGYPAWGRTDGRTPLAAIVFVGVDRGQAMRMGETAKRKAYTWEVTIFGRDEINLGTLVDALLTWLDSTPRVTIGGKPVALAMVRGIRRTSDAETVTEQYGFTVVIDAAW